MDLFREVIGKMDAEENKLYASKICPSPADRLRVKKYSTVTKQQLNATGQNMRLENRLNKQMSNQRGTLAHEPIGPLGTMNRPANHFNVIGSSLPGWLVLIQMGDSKKYSKQMKNKSFYGFEMLDLNKYETLPKLAPLNVHKVSKRSRRDSEEENGRNVQPGFIPNFYRCKEINLLPMLQGRCRINVLSLNGYNYKIRCDATTRILQILENILLIERLEENFFLGLCALIGGDFVFLPSKMRVLKIYERMNSASVFVSKTFRKGEIATITLYFRVKFYLPNIRYMSSKSHHLLYLQLRKSILEQQIVCTVQDMIILGGLALQAEIGDYQPTMESKEYFTTSYYLPEGVNRLKHKEFSKYLRNAHFCKRGVHPRDAEYQFIQYVQQIEEYGTHLYSAILDTKEQQNVYIGISMKGISILNHPTARKNVDANNEVEQISSASSNHRKSYLSFDWIEIENLSYSKHTFSIIVKPAGGQKLRENIRNKYSFKMCGKKNYFAFSLASEHHQLHIKLKGSPTNTDKNNFSDLNLPLLTNITSSSQDKLPKTSLEINTNLYKNRNNNGKFLRNLWHRPKSSNDFLAIEDDEKESNVQTTAENFRNEYIEQPENDDYNNVNSSFKLLSPNRNRVKMGTRVYSSINRSHNEINSLDECSRSCDSRSRTKSLKHQIGFSDLQWNQSLSKCVSVTKSNTDDDLTSQQNSSSKYVNLDSDGMNSNSNEAYVIDSSLGSATDAGLYSLQNESISVTLLDKFINMASTSNNFNDRIITQIAIIKDSPLDQNMRNERKQLSINSMTRQKNRHISGNPERMTLGISIVQGSDKNIYVKDLVRDSPAERHGITVGDQLLAVNDVSILNLSYQEVVDLLRNTGRIVELTISQLYQNFENKLKLKSMSYKNMDTNDHISLHELTNIDEFMNNCQSNFLKPIKSLPNLLNAIK